MAHRDEYYERRLAVSRDGDWTGRCAFFLRAMNAQARENTRNARAVLQLYEARKHWIAEKTRSQYAIQALDFIFRFPIFPGDRFWKQTEIPDQTARNILRSVRGELLDEVRPASGRRPALYVFQELLDITEGRETF